MLTTGGNAQDYLIIGWIGYNNIGDELILHSLLSYLEDERDNITVMGAEFELVGNKEKQNLEIGNGIKITNLSKGKLKEAGLKEGFIITYVNKKPIVEVNDFKREIGNARGGILVEGVYPNGELAYYVFGVE